MIDRATVDKIMDAVRIEEVIGDFVSLRKRGANYLGLCPFHQDKNPSMSVSSTKGIFKCFGRNRHLDRNGETRLPVQGVERTFRRRYDREQRVCHGRK